MPKSKKPKNRRQRQKRRKALGLEPIGQSKKHKPKPKKHGREFLVKRYKALEPPPCPICETPMGFFSWVNGDGVTPHPHGCPAFDSHQADGSYFEWERSCGKTE